MGATGASGGTGDNDACPAKYITLATSMREAAFDVYFSSYGSLSHLTAEQLRICLRAVARHAAPGSLVVLDLVGRYSPEWPEYWQASDEQAKWRPYSMSYLFSDEERSGGEIERFPLRFWTGGEVRELCETISADTAVALRPLELLDRSIFVGRHVDTREYGTRLPPLRRLVNRLFEHNVRTPLEQLMIIDHGNRGDAELVRLVDAHDARQGALRHAGAERRGRRRRRRRTVEVGRGRVVR